MSDARAGEIVTAARALLEGHGREALSMRRIADELGIKAPSIYKHFPDKAAIESAIVADGMREWGDALRSGQTLREIAAHHRAFAHAHPALYELMTDSPLDRSRLPEGLEAQTAAPLFAALPDRDLARAAWAAAHGMVSLELAGRFPDGADLDGAWAALCSALEAAAASGA